MAKFAWKAYIMARLQKSLEKKDRLLQATISLVNNNGFHAAPMSKIAKMAQVSPATIYLYFENKQDLVNQAYLNVKADFTSYIFKSETAHLPLKTAFERIWRAIFNYKLANRANALFLAQCDSTPMIDKTIRNQGIKHLEPLLELWEKGKKENLIKPLSNYLLYGFTINPIAFLILMDERGSYQLNNTIIDQAFETAWQSIKV